MSMPEWKDALPVAPKGADKLLGMWVTSFDQPDASLLVEYMLPSLLMANHSALSVEHENNANLAVNLERLKGKLNIITSMPRNAQRENAYPWLWRYVDHYCVGRGSPVVQHSKLWAFHWEFQGHEKLELYVSSTNLTTSAFKNQLQAGWRCMVDLSGCSTDNNRETWGALVSFIKELGKSAGDAASNRLNGLLDLLGRAKCPNGVVFIASIPGSKKYAAKELKEKFSPTEVHILTPTIGSWNLASLEGWCKQLGVLSNKVYLKWIEDSHPWCQSAMFSLSNDTYKTLSENVNINAIQSFEAKGGVDERWSHAKLYLLCRGRAKWLLITSANWSLSAWGQGSKSPRNFELGVVFKTDWAEIRHWSKKNSRPFLTDKEIDFNDKGIQWAEACWDGECIELDVESTSHELVSAKIKFSGGSEDFIVDDVRSQNEICGLELKTYPVWVEFLQGEQSICIAVQDRRPIEQFRAGLLPESNSFDTECLRNQMLLQRYAGACGGDFDKGSSNESKAVTATSNIKSDYAVSAWNTARAAFDVIGNWNKALIQSGDEYEKCHLKEDGKSLERIYLKNDDVASNLAAEELGWRLRQIND